MDSSLLGVFEAAVILATCGSWAGAGGAAVHHRPGRGLRDGSIRVRLGSGDRHFPIHVKSICPGHPETTPTMLVQGFMGPRSFPYESVRRLRWSPTQSADERSLRLQWLHLISSMIMTSRYAAWKGVHFSFR